MAARAGRAFLRRSVSARCDGKLQSLHPILKDSFAHAKKAITAMPDANLDKSLDWFGGKNIIGPKIPEGLDTKGLEKSTTDKTKVIAALLGLRDLRRGR